MSRPRLGDYQPPRELIEFLIREHGLRSETGVVVCWKCRYRPALMPQLHCSHCLSDPESRQQPRSRT